MRSRRSSRSAPVLTLVLGGLIVLLIGIWLGGHPSWLPSPLRGAFVDRGEDPLVNQVLNLLQRDYYRPVNRSQLVNKGLAGMVASLDDPYSHYYNPSAYQGFLSESNPHDSGIGVNVNNEKQGLRVVGVFAGSPAAQQGLTRGDVIISVGQTSLANRPKTFGPNLIQGKAGTPVTITVLHAGHKRTVTLVRQDLVVPEASGAIVNYHGLKLGSLALLAFTDGAGAELRTQVDKVLHDGARGLILDLRDNPGGLLNEAVNVASIFIPDGTIVSTAGRSQPRQVYVAKGGAISTSIPMVVLVDRGTASAAEIVTGALQDRQRAKVVGTHTYGKGVFQEIEPLPNGGALDFTVGEYFTPLGHNLGGGGVRQGAGITPNVYAATSATGSTDTALAAAERTVAAEVRERAPRAGGGVRATATEAATAPRVAVLARRGKFFVAEPFFGPGPRLVVSRDRSAAVGDLIVVRSGAPRNGRGGGRATIARRLGRSDVARDVIEGLMVDRGLRRGFDPAVEHEARDVSVIEDALSGPDAVSGADAVGGERRDLRALPTFTVDPVSARDFDDAISASDEDDGSRRVWVHIADVSAYVRFGSLLDRDAYRRATSVYVPGAVEPMLPQALSNDACSLVPGQDRLAVTVEMLLDDDRVRRASFYRSVIRSDERLDYDRVDHIFAGRERASEMWGSGLASARAVAAALAARRGAQGALEIDSAEPEFSFDRRGDVVSVEPVEQTESHRMIEHLMIAANEQVARRLTGRRVPTLYRVHERPDGIAAERLIDQLASLGVPTPAVPRGHLAPQQAADLIGEASQLIERWTASRGGRGRRALTSLVLRSLKQAYYDQRNRGHAGLQLASYCHFTSPIRRYPDLICHRALLSTLGGDTPAPEVSWVGAAGPWCSAREREAMSIERMADDIARCFLLERRLSSPDASGVFEGEVVGLAGAGAFVAFGERGEFEGMLPVRRLRGDWWELNEEGTMLVGTRSGSAIRLGDSVSVRVGSIDAPRGRVDLLPGWED